jgi:hypothetical protein
VAAAALTGPSCSSWVKTPDHAITILAVDRLNLGEEFTFTVNVKDARGEPIKKVNYEYRIDWVGTKPYNGKGKTGVLETIRVRGEKGTVTLHILGYDAQDTFGKVAKHTFEIQ